jgi:hypothetical protein
MSPAATLFYLASELLPEISGSSLGDKVIVLYLREAAVSVLCSQQWQCHRGIGLVWRVASPMPQH